MVKIRQEASARGGDKSGGLIGQTISLSHPKRPIRYSGANLAQIQNLEASVQHVPPVESLHFYFEKMFCLVNKDVLPKNFKLPQASLTKASDYVKEKEKKNPTG